MDPETFCTFFMRKGRCRYGERCRDVHPFEDDAQTERMRRVMDERMDVSDDESADSDQYGGSTTMGEPTDDEHSHDDYFRAALLASSTASNLSRSIEPETLAQRVLGPSTSTSIQPDHNETSQAEEAGAPPATKKEDLDSSARTSHPDYYFEDGNMIFLVETHQYRLHRGFIRRHSQFFVIASLAHNRTTWSIRWMASEAKTLNAYFGSFVR